MDSRIEPPDPTAPGDLLPAGLAVGSPEGPPDETLAEFSVFYRSFMPTLVGFLVMQGARPTDAAEAAQETMVMALQFWDRIFNPRSWARKVASRVYVRRMASAAEYPVAELPDMHPPLLRRESDLESIFGQSEVIHYLQTLPPRQREVVAWYYDGYDTPEIAERLGMTPGAVRAARHKARLALSGKLLGFDEEANDTP